MSELPVFQQDPFPNLPPITREERIGKRFWFEEPTNQEEEIIAFLTRGINKLAIINSWAESTKYPEESQFGPPKKYEFVPGQPNGQCGVTAMGIAMVMVWNNIAPPEKIFYEEGQLLNAEGEIIGDHHTWLRIEGDDGKEWRIDVASYQYADGISHPDEMIETVVQGVNHWVGHYADINSRHIDPYTHPQKIRQIPVPNALSLQYKVDEIDGQKLSTPISEYDVSLFEGRLERFMYKYKHNMVRFSTGEHILPVIENKWYPPNYDHSKEAWTPGEDIALVYNEGRIQKIMEHASPTTLAVWAQDCARHTMPLYEKEQSGSELRKLLDSAERLLREDVVNLREVRKLATASLAFTKDNLSYAAHMAIRSVYEAILSTRDPFYAVKAAQNSLYAVLKSDPSLQKEKVIQELEWQQKHLMLLIDMIDQ